MRVVDEYTVAIPNYDGNGMYLSMGNLVQTIIGDFAKSSKSTELGNH